MNAPQAVSTAAPGVFLQACLAPFEFALGQPDVTDIYVNRPGEMWIERLGGDLTRHQDARLTPAVLQRFAQQLAALTHQGINREHPLLSSRLPDGSRIQIVAPPATRGPLALAIRRHLVAGISLDDYQASGAFEDAETSGAAHPSALTEVQNLLSSAQLSGALSLAVRSRMNILVSGGTSTGKTTFLNALLREVPAGERLILIEDTPELAPPHENLVGLVAVRGSLGEARVTTDDLLSASLRMRPDRLILGELRGSEAFAFLRAVNSGHPGSMTTIHADSPERAVEQLALLVLQGGFRLSREDIRHYVRNTVDVYVQLGRSNGRRRVEQVLVRSVDG